MHTSAMEQQKKSLQKQIDALNKVMSGMDSRLDKQKFIESNNTTFMIPKKFELAQARRDEVSQEFVRFLIPLRIQHDPPPP